MAELTLHLSFGSRSLRCVLAAGMICSAASQVASESVTLTTYYPAPSGVYAQMITTGNTFISRDGGYALVGALPPAGTVLGPGFYVNPPAGGGVAIGAAYVAVAVPPAPPPNGMIIQGSVGIANTNPGTAPANPYVGSTVFEVGTVGGTQGTIRTTNLIVTGAVQLPASATPLEDSQVCAPIAVVENGANCPGQYITSISGIYASYMTLTYANYSSQGTAGDGNADTGASQYSIDALCCPCPTAGCTL